MAARSSGVAYQLMVERASKAEADARAARDRALDLQAEWAALAAPAEEAEGLPGGKAIAGVQKHGVGAAEEVAEVRVRIEDAPFPERAQTEVPRYALTPANEYADLPPAMLTVLMTHGEDVLLGTRFFGLLRQSKEERTAYETGDLVPSTPAGGPVVDDSGHVWLVARDGTTLLRFDGREWRREAPGTEGELLAVTADEAGRVWALSRHEGVLRLAKRGAEGLVPARDIAFGDRTDALSVTLLSVGADESVWLAVTLPGRRGRSRPAGVVVVRPDGGAIHHRMGVAGRLPDTAEGFVLPSDRVTGLALRGERVFIATFGGVCELTPSDYRVEGENEGLESEVLRDVVVDEDGHPWVATSMGVARRGDRWEGVAVSKGLPSKDVRRLTIGPRGVVWALTKGGPARRTDGGWEPVAVKGLRSSEGTDLLVTPNGRVWVRAQTALVMKAD